jgi:hypothetical protein
MGCADVCIDMGYDAHNEFYAEKMVKARKAHECCECGAAVLPGMAYQSARGKSEGMIFTYGTCALCVEVREAFVCGTWVFGRLWETVEQEMYPAWRKLGSWDCLAKLTTPAAIAYATARYKQWLIDNDYDGPPQEAPQ